MLHILHILYSIQINCFLTQQVNCTPDIPNCTRQIRATFQEQNIYFSLIRLARNGFLFRTVVSLFQLESRYEVWL
jgi:hypothetical protein